MKHFLLCLPEAFRKTGVQSGCELKSFLLKTHGHSLIPIYNRCFADQLEDSQILDYLEQQTLGMLSQFSS